MHVDPRTRADMSLFGNDSIARGTSGVYKVFSDRSVGIHPRNLRLHLTGALADEVERLREASVALTQRLSEAVAKAERAVRDERQAIAAQAEAEEAREAAAAAAAVAAEREEEGERHRKEMEHSLAEVRKGGDGSVGNERPGPGKG